MSSHADPNLENTLPPSMDPADPGEAVEPPRHLLGILSQLGPGLIIAGSIVGSGELIATTRTGAQAGISLLWLILVGCVIKVFCQIELGRYTIIHGETTLAALNRVPGPRAGANWIVWFWVAMMLAGLAQLGGIVGGVGQALAISFPITGDYARSVIVPAEGDLKAYLHYESLSQAEREKLPAEERARREHARTFIDERLAAAGELGTRAREAAARLAAAEAEFSRTRNGDESARNRACEVIRQRKKELDALLNPPVWDDLIWAVAIGAATSALLSAGTYGFIQSASTVMVVAFTFITLGNVFALQNTLAWRITWAEFGQGLSFQPPPGANAWKAWQTALATFGIIGVGASELVAYPYWCLERGYARFTGRRTDGPEWGARARGWMRVMQWDAWCSMAVYTVATVAFYLLGVSVLHRLGLTPDDKRMVTTLAEAYVPIFGTYARWLFLVGALAVLYSTYLVANAGHARTITDCLKIMGVIDKQRQEVHDRWISGLSLALPLVCVVLFATRFNPVSMVLLGGTMQSLMLPMLGGAALYFRCCKQDARLLPHPAWDLFLALSFLGFLVVAGWSLYSAMSQVWAPPNPC